MHCISLYVFSEHIFVYFRFDCALVEILDPEFASVESKMDSRLQSNPHVLSSVLSINITILSKNS